MLISILDAYFENTKTNISYTYDSGFKDGNNLGIKNGYQMRIDNFQEELHKLCSVEIGGYLVFRFVE